MSPQPTSSAGSAALPAPRFIGPADDGRTYSLQVGQTTTLRIGDPDAAEPVADGAAVLLVAVVNVTDSGAREWEVRAVEPGAATIRGAGETTWEIGFAVGE